MLCALPSDVLLLVLGSACDARDVGRLEQCCSQLRNVIQAHGDALWRRLLVNMFFIHATGISKITRLSLPAGAGSGQAKLLYAMLCGELEVGREFSGTVSGYAWDRCFAIGYDGRCSPPKVVLRVIVQGMILRGRTAQRDPYPQSRDDTVWTCDVTRVRRPRSAPTVAAAATAAGRAVPLLQAGDLVEVSQHLQDAEALLQDDLDDGLPSGIWATAQCLPRVRLGVVRAVDWICRYDGESASGGRSVDPCHAIGSPASCPAELARRLKVEVEYPFRDEEGRLPTAFDREWIHMRSERLVHPCHEADLPPGVRSRLCLVPPPFG